MIAISMSLVSWIVWLVWMGFGLVWELTTVLLEKKRGTLPLTRIVRDRAMRKSTIAKLGVLLFLTWLWVHFVTPLEW